MNIKLTTVCLMVFCVWRVIGQSSSSNTTSDYPELQANWSYCLQYTWFGPDYNNVTKYNGTCADYLEETRADGVPCASPIVISYDGSTPDQQWLWDNHKNSILCVRSKYQRCVRYTYYYNNQVYNVSYTCAKVQSGDGGIIDEGCFKQTLTDGYKTEVCVCKSTPGTQYQPCNGNGTMRHTIHISLIIASIIYQFWKNI